MLGKYQAMNVALGNKIQKLHEQEAQEYKEEETTGILDLGCTSGVAAVNDTHALKPTGEVSNKMFIMSKGDRAKVPEKMKI